MIGKITNSNFYNNKFLLKGLKFASEKSPIFTAGTSLLFQSTIRPLSTMLTPKTDREDKKISCIKSLSSAISGFLFMLIVSTPFSKAVKNIDKNPGKFLNKDTIKALSGDVDNIANSKSYKFITQLFKLGLTFLLAYPKALINNTIIPKAIEKTSKNKEPQSFSGKIENIVADTINNKTMQKAAQYAKKTDYTTHLIALGDIFSTLAFTTITNKNKKLSKHQKKVLNYNAITSTALCLAMGYGANKILDKPMGGFIKNLEKANKNSPDLSKYKEGAEIVKTSVIFAMIYYGLIPMMSTFISSKAASKTCLKGENSL